MILIIVMAIPIVVHSQWLLDRGVDLQAAFPTVPEGLSGLSSTATVTVLCMFILSAGIQRSGLLHVIGKRVFPLVGGSELRQLLVVALRVAPVSGFINNTAAVAMAIPLVLDIARRSRFQAYRVLLPLSFCGMLGGTLTLIGTSTNILASSILKGDPQFGREIGMFEFSHVGLNVLGTGLLYFLTIGRWLLPRQDAAPLAAEDEEHFVIELGLAKDSPLLDQTLEAAQFSAGTGVSRLKLLRSEQTIIKRAEETPLEQGDLLLVRATLRQIMDLITDDRVEVLSEFGETGRVRNDGKLVAVLLRNRLVFNGRTARGVDFFGGRVIGLDTGFVRGRRLADEKLHVGEIVLMEISRTALVRLRRNAYVVVLGEFDDDFDRRRMVIAGGIVLAVVVAAVVTPLPHSGHRHPRGHRHGRSSASAHRHSQDPASASRRTVSSDSRGSHSSVNR